MPLPPARVGNSLTDVETPALLLDLDVYERNLDRMARAVARSPVRLRAHAKTHKCSIIARHQVDRGAVGVCCQTLAEAEAMVAGGIVSVMITNQIVSVGKIARLVALAQRAEVFVCVDDESNVHNLDTAAREAGVRLPVLVEVDIGQHRCGVDPGEPTLSLALAVAACPHLRFAGLQAYQGNAQHIADIGERTSAMSHALALVRETVALLESRGIRCEIVAGGGTGTWPIEASSGVYNEVQSGSYIFMDADYNRVALDGPSFENALFLLTTVVSRQGTRAVCDAGLKAGSTDSGLPVVVGFPEVHYEAASDEHGNLRLDSSSVSLRVGDTLRLIPGHCDPTVNLHDWYVCVRNGVVEALWPIGV